MNNVNNTTFKQLQKLQKIFVIEERKDRKCVVHERQQTKGSKHLDEPKILDRE